MARIKLPSREVVRVLVWGVVLSGLVHVDWHVGRPADMPPSLEWPLHWILGLVTGAAMGWLFLKESANVHSGVDLLVAIGLGLVLGQVMGPVVEMVGFGVSFAEVVPAVRWVLFAQFTVALMGSVAAVGASTRLGRRAHNA